MSKSSSVSSLLYTHIYKKTDAVTFLFTSIVIAIILLTYPPNKIINIPPKTVTAVTPLPDRGA